jgi:hypothetical protein
MPKHKGGFNRDEGDERDGYRLNTDSQGVDLSRLSFLSLLSLFTWLLSSVSPSSLLNPAFAAHTVTLHSP